MQSCRWVWLHRRRRRFTRRRAAGITMLGLLLLLLLDHLHCIEIHGRGHRVRPVLLAVRTRPIVAVAELRNGIVYVDLE